MAETTDSPSITIESPFGTLVTNAVRLAKFAADLAAVAERAGHDPAAAPLMVSVGGIRLHCHPNGGDGPIGGGDGGPVGSP